MTTGTELSLHCPGTGEPRRSETQSSSRVRLDPKEESFEERQGDQLSTHRLGQCKS